MTDNPNWHPPYEGNDMIGYIMRIGWQIPDDRGPVRSMTNVRDCAIIVTDYGVWRAKPSPYTGFSVELAAAW
jgi:hypothetical protein